MKNSETGEFVDWSDEERALIITNDGPGIARGFDPFTPGTTTSKEGKGGYGLPYMKALAESHGWELTYTSEPGRTVFMLRLKPISKPHSGVIAH